MLGKQILNYEIKSLLGEGGMGNVYLGEHLSIGRKVAIKVLRPELSSKDEIRKRFKNEARVMAQLQHPGIVGLYDFHEDENGLYLIMEYVQGEELAQKIARLQEPMNIEEAKGIMIKVLEAFKYAHANGIIHRDVKPANILIDYSNNVKVLDFGIAKIVGSEQFNLTRDGSHVGTAYYMSPEQVKATELDKRSDIYSLGVNFYEMLAGFCPYKSLTSEYDIYTKIVQEPLTSLVETMGSDYNNVWEVISKATSKHPESRYQNCQEMIEDLKSDKTTMKSTITQHSGSENAQMSQSPISTKRSTNKGLRAGLIVAAVVITGLIAFIVMNGRENDVNTGAPEPDNQADVSNETESYEEEESLRQPILTASSSSNILASSGFSYNASNAIDGNISTWWSPKTNQTGSKWLKINLGDEFTVTGMNIHGGSHYPNFREFGNLFYKNWRISKARIDFSDGTSEIIWLDDVDDIQEVDFSRSVNTSYMLIVPLDYYEQYDGWDDYCISEVSPIVSL